ncbi:hypothetical protein RHMOL_Rhmol03G0089600 [Rhododendron molle]|uniref:Uncharacterized protein n=1 Tax=Rhododendron molle TaxID=49168 RepID=A0ACC0PDL3_RHOML|nr:hypothetical protein RHMOL_Rhmol03G0089600 [Rhododendron molle]
MCFRFSPVIVLEGQHKVLFIDVSKTFFSSTFSYFVLEEVEVLSLKLCCFPFDLLFGYFLAMVLGTHPNTHPLLT